MNIAAHLNPVVLVIDPLSDPCAPRAIPYSLQVAFAASGMIMAGMPGLAKLQRSQTFADAEAELAAVMAGGVLPQHRPGAMAHNDRPQRKSPPRFGHRFYAAQGAARAAQIIAILRECGPLARVDLRYKMGLTESSMKRTMDQMVKRGQVTAFLSSARRIAYEVAE